MDRMRKVDHGRVRRSLGVSAEALAKEDEGACVTRMKKDLEKQSIRMDRFFPNHSDAKSF
jgi:hypothetical protein